ncbi:hypothetical protein [Subtercola vilae]|uniref:Uncharacterized protein n=1 Tax=Subtercola vilae TaxID=2056433 RepID=A0A4T2BQE1_9MICO|nr:hypothetical protein [Subtercola vilae]TIH31646.1 hypothetical protein D4765_16310 [Subtercola vilae]
MRDVEDIGAPTPLGEVRLSFAVAGVTLASTPLRQLKHHREIYSDWRFVENVRVESYRVPLPTTRFAYDLNDVPIGAEGSWGIVARFTARADSGPLEMRASLNPTPPDSRLASGEMLALREFRAEGVTVVVGGGDLDFYLRSSVDGRLPRRWDDPDETTAHDEMGVTDWMLQGLAGASTLPVGADGIGWKLPALRSDEVALLHVTIAWGRTKTSAVAARLAVDTTPSEILRHSTFARNIGATGRA